jgi:sugar lactone lactonase YvrE
LGFRQKGGFVCAGRDGFYFWSPGENILHPITNPEEHHPESRFNDGKVDRMGRFWAGTMTQQGAVSALYRLGTSFEVTKMESNITISNGIGWSLDQQTMYYVDSKRYVIYAYDFDLPLGEISNRRHFIEVSPAYGIPDGLTVDAEGFIWCAFYGGSKVTRFNPNGEIDLEVPLPVSQPTCCAFGGSSMMDLFITTARDGLSEEALAEQPLAGDVFMIQTGVRGLPESEFLG